MTETRHIELTVENSPTILVRVIQVIKRRRLNIKTFSAKENIANDANIQMVLEANPEQIRLLKTQFRKLVEVISVK